MLTHAMRWIIEEYHKCLKTGCRFEQRQLKNNRRIERLMGFLAVVALRLLQLREQMKNGQYIARSYVPDLALEVLAKKISLDPESITLRQFWIEVAKIGGFLARKSDGDPGWITIWRGWNDLQKMCEGASIMSCG
ncbi:MAG: IS4 family transposase [Candidatus Woesearchaeota archaeon]